MWVRIPPGAPFWNATDRGQHRAPSIPNLLIAGTAEKAGLTVLAADKDFNLLAAVTGQPVEILNDHQTRGRRRHEPVSPETA